MNKFSTFQITKILNIKRELLAQWLMRGYINPSIQKAEGRGSKNLFSRNDLYNIKLFQIFIECGMQRDEAKLYIDLNFDSVGPEEGDKKFLFVRRMNKKSGRDRGLIAHLSIKEKWPEKSPHKDGQAWFMSIDLLGIKNLVNRKIQGT